MPGFSERWTITDVISGQQEVQVQCAFGGWPLLNVNWRIQCSCTSHFKGKINSKVFQKEIFTAQKLVWKIYRKLLSNLGNFLGLGWFCLKKNNLK